jgi:hypothetical protein
MHLLYTQEYRSTMNVEIFVTSERCNLFRRLIFRGILNEEAL